MEQEIGHAALDKQGPDRDFEAGSAVEKQPVTMGAAQMNGYMTRALGLTLICFTTAAVGQQPDLPKPGTEHKVLEESVGTWDCTVKMAESPGESKCTSVSRMSLGGLWLVTDFEGDFGGIPFQGHGLDSYDKTTKKYVGVWVDSMSTGPIVMEGDYDARTRTLTMTGEGPGMTGKPVRYRNVTTLTDRDHHTFRMYQVEGDKESLMMTIEYTRRK